MFGELLTPHPDHLSARDATSRGVAILEKALTREGFGVVHALNDPLVDLVVGDRAAGGPPRVVPIRVHASPHERFDVGAGDRPRDGLVLAYVWEFDARPRIFLMGAEEVEELANHSLFFQEFGSFVSELPGGFLLRQIEACEGRWAWLRRRIAAARPSSRHAPQGHPRHAAVA